MVKVPTKPAKPAPARGAIRQRALVVGVSGYRAPIIKLPAVAADVRAIAKLLSSKDGVFQPTGVRILTERQATRSDVLATLKEVFSRAKASDTIFVYLAGHGSVDGAEYYFIPYDAKVDRLAETGVPLSEIKRLFDRTASKRVFLWLDFCHSGGILARGGKADDRSAIQRAIGVISGEGKVILAACTPSQSAYEDSALGHGLFTHALLRGLSGEAKSAHGEVTALSLYDFIDHQVGHPKQQPMFHGELAGRIVLMNYPDRTVVVPAGAAAKLTAKPKAPAKTPATSRVNASGNLLLLDGRIYAERSVREQHDGSVEIEVIPKDPEEEAALSGLRTDQFSPKRNVSFAFRNKSFTGQVGEVTSVTTGAKPAWTVILKPVSSRGSYMSGVNYGSIPAEKLTEMRARLLLLGEKPALGEMGHNSMLLSYIQGPLKEQGMTEAVFTALWKQSRLRPGDFLKRARLHAMYYLRAGEICDDVLELRLGPVRAGKMAVRFRGRRNARYSGATPEDILVEGLCPLA